MSARDELRSHPRTHYLPSHSVPSRPIPRHPGPLLGSVYISVPGLELALLGASPHGWYAGVVYNAIRPDIRPKSKYYDAAFSNVTGEEIYPRAPPHSQARRLAHPAAHPARPAAATHVLSCASGYVDGIAEFLSSDVASCIAHELHAFTIPSPIADVTTGAAVRRCRAAPTRRLSLPLSPAAAGLLVPEETLLIARHCDRSVVLEPAVALKRAALLNPDLEDGATSTTARKQQSTTVHFRLELH